jgi:hypothetical protein
VRPYASFAEGEKLASCWWRLSPGASDVAGWCRPSLACPTASSGVPLACRRQRRQAIEPAPPNSPSVLHEAPHPRQLEGERLPLSPRVLTSPPHHPNAELHDQPMRRQILELARIVTPKASTDCSTLGRSLDRPRSRGRTARVVITTSSASAGAGAASTAAPIPGLRRSSIGIDRQQPAGGSDDTAPAPGKRSTIRTYLDHQIRRLIGYDPSRKPLVMGDETRDRWRIHRGH